MSEEGKDMESRTDLTSPSQLMRIANRMHQRLQTLQINNMVKASQSTLPMMEDLERLSKIGLTWTKAAARGWAKAANLMSKRAETCMGSTHLRIGLTLDRIKKLVIVAAPTLRELYGELVQLREEFNGLEYDHKDQLLIVKTEEIELEEICFGEFELALAIERLSAGAGSGSFIVSAVDPNPAAGDPGVTHPHVNNERICAGEASLPIRVALCSGRVCDAFMMMRSVLSVYNPSSPHVSLENWDGRPCYSCGCFVPDDDMFYCSSCEEDFCEDCMHFCNSCNTVCCNSCVLGCPICGNFMCRACMTVCPDCGDPICKNCYEDGECPCNSEEQEDDIDEQPKGDASWSNSRPAIERDAVALIPKFSGVS